MFDTQKAIEILSSYTNSYFGDSLHGGEIGVADIIEILKKQEKVILCKNCKHCEIFGNGYNSYCDAGHNIMYVDGFCSEAELEENNNA